MKQRPELVSASLMTGISTERLESGKRFIVVDQLALSQDEHGAKMNLKLSALFIDDGEPRATR